MTENSGVLDKGRSTVGSGGERKLYSLVEVAQKTGIPMPILLRYKREHPGRVPSEGSGSQQRFPEEAFQALLEIRKEESESQDLPRRGGFGLLSLPRLRKQKPASDEAAGEEASVSATEEAPAAAPKRERKAAAKAAAPSSRAASATPSAAQGDLLSLVEISERLDIPYPTLARYASQHADRIPHQGRGRGRRFPPEALDVFQQIRKESKPGRPPKAKKREPARAKAPAAPPPTPAPAPDKERPAARTAERGVAGEEKLAQRIASLERSQKVLEGQIRELISALSKPATVTLHQV